MKVQANAALGPAGRLALCQLVDGGMSLRAAAAALNVAPATAHRWWHRRLAASAKELRSGVWLCDRSSRPRRQPRRLSTAEEEPILRARRETGLGPGRLAGIVRRARSTIWKVLRRHGVSRLRRAGRESHRRYQWSRPGALLHVDTARLARFRRPGHRVRGRSTKSRKDRPAMGFVYLHACVDDHSRYAYVEQHPDERAETAAGFMRRAIEHFQALGLAAPEAVMSDNGNAYRSPAFRAELERVAARQILTPPYTPRWNGKVERFFQTLKREWAYAHPWPTSPHRTRALRSFIRYYNRRRPHSSLGDRPPISRVHHLRGQDS
jgi:transposase InsO family protein